MEFARLLPEAWIETTFFDADRFSDRIEPGRLRGWPLQRLSGPTRENAIRSKVESILRSELPCSTSRGSSAVMLFYKSLTVVVVERCRTVEERRKLRSAKGFAKLNPARRAWLRARPDRLLAAVAERGATVPR